MKVKRILLIIILLYCSIITTGAFSQNDNDKRTVGLSATLQGLQFGINLPIWFGDQVIIGPSFKLVYAEKVGSDFGLGLISKIYIKCDKVSPYIGLKFGFISNTPDKTLIIQQKSTTDLYGGFSFGGEYFFDRQFSISMELQGNVTKSDSESYRFGNPGGLIFNTASMVAANIYF